MDAVTGIVVRDAGKLRKGQHLKTRLKRGDVTSVVDKASEPNATGHE
jgi:hypothetical protein